MKCNTELSLLDKRLIGLLYPKPNLTRARENPQDLSLHQLPLSIVRPHRDRIEADSGKIRQDPFTCINNLIALVFTTIVEVRPMPIILLL